MSRCHLQPKEEREQAEGFARDVPAVPLMTLRHACVAGRPKARRDVRDGIIFFILVLRYIIHVAV